MVNSEIELDLSWTKDCVLIAENNNITGVNFVITSTKLYVPGVTLSINDNSIFQKISSKDLKEQFFETNTNLKQRHNQKAII